MVSRYGSSTHRVMEVGEGLVLQAVGLAPEAELGVVRGHLAADRPPRAARRPRGRPGRSSASSRGPGRLVRPRAARARSARGGPRTSARFAAEGRRRTFIASAAFSGVIHLPRNETRPSRARAAALVGSASTAWARCFCRWASSPWASHQRASFTCDGASRPTLAFADLVRLQVRPGRRLRRRRRAPEQTSSSESMVATPTSLGNSSDIRSQRHSFDPAPPARSRQNRGPQDSTPPGLARIGGAWPAGRPGI